MAENKISGGNQNKRRESLKSSKFDRVSHEMSKIVEVGVSESSKSIGFLMKNGKS